MTVETQYEIYLKQITGRKRNPVKDATQSAYQSYWRSWIAPQLGQMEVSQVENGVMKAFVAHLADKGLGASTIAGITNCVKGIVASCVDSNGNAIYPRVWNSDFIDAPLIENQKAPILGKEALSEAIRRTQGQFRTLCILAAGSGLRVGETLALKVGNCLESSYWDRDESKLVIRKTLWRGVEQTTKTAAGIREVDLSPELNEYLRANLPQANGFMFADENGQSIPVRILYDAARKAGIPGFHSFRRWRVTHLENMGVPRTLVQFWIGHSTNNSITDRYCKLDQEKQARKEWCLKAGLGFALPQGEKNEKEEIKEEVYV